MTNYMGADATVYDQIDPKVTSAFVGYDSLTAESDDYRTDHRQRADRGADRRPERNHFCKGDPVLRYHGRSAG